MRIIIAVPVFNEERVLRSTVEQVLSFADSGLAGHDTAVVVVDNGSTDKTREIGAALAAADPRVSYRRLETKGKGLAVRTAWTEHQADVFVFMDADLATDLAALPALINAAAESGGMAVGSRFLPESRVERPFLRRVLSAGYRFFVGFMLKTRISDLPCGFKAAAAAVVKQVVPDVKDDSWFFDTELAVRAERAGFAVREIPVVWREGRTPGRRSKVAVFRLVLEYIRKVARLRREFHAAGKISAPTLRQFLKGISAEEWRIVAAVGIAAAVITAIPPLYGLFLAYTRGSVWNGRQFMSAGDFNVYLSYIEQVRQGRILFENLFTTERLIPVFNALWLGVGALARFLRLSPLAAFHVVRTILIPPLAVIAYCFIAYFLREKKKRLLALLLFMFGSGLGIYFAPLFDPLPAGARYEWPIDMWVAESNTFLTMLYSPHFIASLSLILLALFLLLFAFISGRLRYAAAAGLAALLLFQFHPFHAPTLYAVPAAWLLWQTFRRRSASGQWLAYAVFVVLSLPAAAYHYYLTHYDRAAAALLSANINITPSVWHLLIGLGAISVLWVFGYRQARHAAADPALWDFLAAWVIVQGLLVYAPLPFQRRLIEGIEFPLIVLSVPAVFCLTRWFWGRIRSGQVFRLVVSAALMSVVFLPSTVSAMYRSLNIYRYDPPPHFFHSREQAAALEWLRRSSPAEAVVLGSLESGNAIPGWSGRRVYAGHWVNTVDLGRKAAEILDFFGTMSDAQRLEFARSRGISLIYCGPIERDLGGCPADPAGFPQVFRSGGTVILGVAADRH